MPGLFGIVSTSPESTVASTAAAMAARLKHHSWYVEHRHINENTGVALGRVSLGFVNTAAQPAFNEDRSLLSIMEGEVYGYDEQRRALEKAGHVFHGDSHAELLLHGFEQSGQSFFRTLHGSFSGVIWNGRERRLILVNDRFGLKPLYYAHFAGRLLFASEIKALLADPALSRQSDWRGIAQFFTFGQLLGTDTMLEAVKGLPAAGWLTFDAREDRLSVERYHRLGDNLPTGQHSEAEWLDRIDDAFGKAVARRVEGNQPLCLSLSGGLDSRTILAAVPTDRPLSTVCSAIEGSIDLRSAEEMARLTGRPFHPHQLDDRFLSRFEEHLRHMVHLTDGHYLSACIILPTLPFYRDLGVEVLLRGHAGELMHMNKAYNYSLDAKALTLSDSASLESWLFNRLHSGYFDQVQEPLFTAGYQDRILGLARQSLRECLAESEGLDPFIHRIWHLFASQRTRRETALSMVKFGSVVETRLPFVDNDLVDVLLAAPPELKLGDKIQSHIMRRRMSSFLRVVNANTGMPMGSGPLATKLGKLRMKILAKLGVKGYLPYEQLGLWLRRELRPLVERLLLSPRCLERGIFNGAAVRSVVADHLSQRRNHTYLLMALMIFEQGQRQFHDGDAVTPESAPPPPLVATTTAS